MAKPAPALPQAAPETPPRRVILESPFRGKTPAETSRNMAYARCAMRDSLRRAEAPIASHLLYTQPGVLDDNEPAERAQGIAAGLAWGAVSEATVVYEDLGISPGMTLGIQRAKDEGRRVEYRRLRPVMIAALREEGHAFA